MALTKLGASRANRVNKSKHKQNGVASTLPSTAKDVRFLPLATLRADRYRRVRYIKVTFGNEKDVVAWFYGYMKITLDFSRAT
jgi:hypothetical protein